MHYLLEKINDRLERIHNKNYNLEFVGGIVIVLIKALYRILIHISNNRSNRSEVKITKGLMELSNRLEKDSQNKTKFENYLRKNVIKKYKINNKTYCVFWYSHKFMNSLYGEFDEQKPSKIKNIEYCITRLIDNTHIEVYTKTKNYGDPIFFLSELQVGIFKNRKKLYSFIAKTKLVEKLIHTK